MKWLERNWPNSTIFLAAYLSLMLVLFVRNDYPLLIWARLPAYFLHEFEEYVLPGGFLKWFNRHALHSPADDWPLTPLIALWLNVPIIFIAFPISGVLATEFGLNYGLWMAYFAVVNASGHLIMSFIFRGYNPGLIVSALLNIPLGIYTIGYLISNHLVSTFANTVGLLVGIALQLAVMVYGFLILKPRILAKPPEEIFRTPKGYVEKKELDGR
jgi:hypothetical protein